MDKLKQFYSEVDWTENTFVPMAYKFPIIRVLQRKTQFQSCTETAIPFFVKKIQNFENYTQTAILFFFFFFYSEIQNFKVERNDYPFFFQKNTKFWKLYPVIRFLQRNTKFGKCTEIAIRFFSQRNTEFWKLYSNGHLYFSQGNTRSNYLSTRFSTF